MDSSLYGIKIASANFDPATVKGVATELINIPVQSGRTLILAEFANDIDAAIGWGDVQWDILADGFPVPDFSPIEDQYGTTSLMFKVPFGLIQAKKSLVVTATHNDTSEAGNILNILAGVKYAFLDSK